MPYFITNNIILKRRQKDKSTYKNSSIKRIKTAKFLTDQSIFWQCNKQPSIKEYKNSTIPNQAVFFFY